MSRPKPPEDPQLRATAPCGRCGMGYKTAVVWPDGRVCFYCRLKAIRTRGTCTCGHEGVLPGLIDGRPACRSCANIELYIDCRVCGAEDEIYRDGKCWRCVLAELVEERLADPATGRVSPVLRPFADALNSMKRANSGLTWIRQPHVTEFLRTLAAQTETTHEKIDELPRSNTREHVRALLVEHGVIPARDDRLARFEAWALAAFDRLPAEHNRALIARYVRWAHVRRMRQMSLVSQGTFLRAKQSTTVAINFLNWLDEREIRLENANQGHIDAWMISGPSTNQQASRFLSWAVRSRLCNRNLKIPAHRRGTSARLSADAQQSAIESHLTMTAAPPDGISARDRAIMILVLVFGQILERVVALTWDDISVTSEAVTIRLGTIDILLPVPLDEPWRQLHDDPLHGLTASHPNSFWVFRGYRPGRHIGAQYMHNRIKRHFSVRAARLGTLHELTHSAPIPIIAEALGYNPQTIELHARGSAATYTEYVALRASAGSNP
ncbi:MAG TPA: Fis family transcriptional regulator [Gryllotalpicola sp.]